MVTHDTETNQTGCLDVIGNNRHEAGAAEGERIPSRRLGDDLHNAGSGDQGEWRPLKDSNLRPSSPEDDALLH